jgi:hypothetical protein
MSATSHEPMITAPAMVRAMALVLRRAETCYRGGASSEDAINEALRVHPATMAVAVACRVAWSTMIGADDGDEEPTGQWMALAPAARVDGDEVSAHAPEPDAPQRRATR